MKKLDTETTASPIASHAFTYDGSEGWTFSCTAETKSQITDWIADAQKVMHGAKANRSDVISIMVAALVESGWTPGQTVKLSISRKGQK